MKHIFLFIAVLASYTISAQEYLVNAEFLNTTPSFLLGIVPGIPTSYDVDFYKLTYNTVDTDGQPTIASGSIALPADAPCSSLPIMAYCHGTVLRQNDVPSADNLEGLLTKVFASTGYITVAPDYLGLGENQGFHPYVHAESQATATIDLMRAAREFLEGLIIEDNGQTLITGYSQGGHAAMATLHYAQENGLNEELGIIAGAPCSGPYNISDTQANVLVSDQPYSNPGYAIYVIMSYETVYGNIYNELSDVVQEPYATQVLPYFDGMQDEDNMGAVNALLPSLISEFLVDTLLENFQSNPNHPLWVALRDNDNFDWVPEVPLRMFYCTGDEQVAFENSLVAESTMQENGASDVVAINSLPGADHSGCVIPALTDVFEFFVDNAPPCAVLNTEEYLEPIALDLFPNPAQNVVNFRISETEGVIYLQDISGKTVLQKNLNSANQSLDLSSYAKGIYILSIQTESNIYRGRLVRE